MGERQGRQRRRVWWRDRRAIRFARKGARLGMGRFGARLARVELLDVEVGSERLVRLTGPRRSVFEAHVVFVPLQGARLFGRFPGQGSDVPASDPSSLLYGHGRSDEVPPVLAGDTVVLASGVAFEAQGAPYTLPSGRSFVDVVVRRRRLTGGVATRIEPIDVLSITQVQRPEPK